MNEEIVGGRTVLRFKEWLYHETLALAGNYKGGFFMRLVVASYKLAPVSDPAALPAFQELARKMTRQNDFLRHDYNFIPPNGDHYSSLKQLRRSIDAQRQAGKRRADMYVYAEPPGPKGDASQSGHPVYTNDQNVMIRGVQTPSPTSAAIIPSTPVGSTGLMRPQPRSGDQSIQQFPQGHLRKPCVVPDKPCGGLS